MTRKLKRLFSMLLVVSMIMSQVSVAAFAEELNLITGSNAEILSSDTREGYYVSTDSDCESVPQTSSNASIESETVVVPGQQAMLAGMLPETVEVTDLRLLSVIDGTPNFDEDNKPGNDKDENNGILRTLDTVTYNLRMAIQEPEEPTRDGGEDKIWFKAVIPGRKAGEVQFLTESMEWLNDPVVKDSDEGLTLTGYTEVAGTDTSVYWQDYSVPMKAYQMDQGEKFAPKFYAWVDGQAEPMAVTEGTEITVSAKDALNLSLKFDSLSEEDYFDFTVDSTNTSAANANVGEVHGAIFALAFRAEVLSERNDLKGVKMPDGDIEFDIDLSLTDDYGTSIDITNEKVPLLWDYLQIKTGDEAKGSFGRTLTSSILCRSLLPYSFYNNKYAERCVYDSGDLKITQSGAKLHVTIEDYVFADDAVFPKETISGDNFGQQQGIFSSGLIQIVVPYSPTDTTLYTINAVIDQVTLNNKATDQVTVADDSASCKIQSGSGNYNQMLALSHKDEYKDMDTRLELGSKSYSGVGQGISYAYPGEEIYVTWSTAPRRYLANWNGADLLIKFADMFEVPEIEDIKVYATALSRSGDNFGLDKTEDRFEEVHVSYAARPDGEGWENEDQMDDASVLDLVFYDSKKEAEDNNAVIVGVLAELRDGNQYNESFRVVCTMPVKVSEKAKIGYVYPFYHETYLYDVNKDSNGNGLSLKHGLAHLDSANMDDINTRINNIKNKFLGSYGKTGSDIAHRVGSSAGKTTIGNDIVSWFTYEYDKSIYKDGEVTSGTHLARYGSGDDTSYGQFGGNSLLIVGTEATIEKSIEQTGADNEARSIFNMSLGQREVDFMLEPAYRFTVENVLKDEYDTLTITDTLDKHLTYIEGSAFQGGTYDSETESLTGGTALEPTVTVNSNGCQVLTWVLENQKAGDDIEPIHYSCVIGTRGNYETDVKNGDLVKNTVSISAPKDVRPVAELYGKVAVSSFQVIMGKGSSLSKAVDKEYAELADEIAYEVVFSNDGSEGYHDLLVRDILPYKGDGRGTDFKGGTYKVTSVKLATSSDASGDIYVTTAKPSEMPTLEDMYAMTDCFAGWTKLEEGTSLEGITAVAWKGDVPAGQILAIAVELEINCPVTRALFVNNAEAYTSDHQQLASLKVKTTVLPRKVSGVAWFDADEDGSRDNGEALLAGIKVTLLDKEGNAVKDVYGNAVNAVVTGNDGAYCFDNLLAGEYQVKFESDIYKLDSLVVTAKDAVDDAVDSDAVAVYDGESLKAAVIAGIDLPELEEIAEKKLDEWHEAHLDAGFHNPEKPEDPTSPSEPETKPSEPETTPTEPETTPSNPTSTPKDDDDDDKPVKPTTPTVPETTPQETVTDVITEIVPETTPLPEVSPDARPEDIPQEVLDAYYERYIKGEIDLDDIPMGVLGAFYEKGLLAAAPHTGDPSNIWTLMMLISMIGLAVTSVIDRKRVRK